MRSSQEEPPQPPRNKQSKKLSSVWIHTEDFLFGLDFYSNIALNAFIHSRAISACPLSVGWMPSQIQ